jgi:GNAT superfamily N-acetyltransferase
MEPKSTHVIRTVLLADCPETIPTLAQWFRSQWSDYYATRSVADIVQDFHAELNRNRLPLRLVAFVDGRVAGTASLREQAMKGLPEFTPGLGGLFVVEQYRNLGIGTKLVSAAMKIARDLGYDNLYAATMAASGILERLGWKLVRLVQHDNEHVGLYSCHLTTATERT